MVYAKVKKKKLSQIFASTFNKKDCVQIVHVKSFRQIYPPNCFEAKS